MRYCSSIQTQLTDAVTVSFSDSKWGKFCQILPRYLHKKWAQKCKTIGSCSGQNEVNGLQWHYWNAPLECSGMLAVVPLECLQCTTGMLAMHHWNACNAPLECLQCTTGMLAMHHWNALECLQWHHRNACNDTTEMLAVTPLKCLQWHHWNALECLQWHHWNYLEWLQ